MNCLEFRRRLGSEPASKLSAFVAHREECVHCAAAQFRADEFEGRIHRAITVPVPLNLADRILLAQTTETRQSARNQRRGWIAFSMAAAASIVVAFVAVQRPSQNVPALAGMVFEHLQKHVVSTVDSDTAIPKQSVIEAFAERGVNLAAVPDGINYVHKCPAGPYETVHMVMPEHGVAVSVVYVVDKSSTQRLDFSHDGMRGREIPLGKGSLVMWATASQDFDAIENSWKSVIGESIALEPGSVPVVSGSRGVLSGSSVYRAAFAAP